MAADKQVCVSSRRDRQTCCGSKIQIFGPLCIKIFYLGMAWKRWTVARGQSPTFSIGTACVARNPTAEGRGGYRVYPAHRAIEASFLPAGPLYFRDWKFRPLSKRAQRQRFKEGEDFLGGGQKRRGRSTSHSLCSKQHVFPGVEVAGVRVLSVQVLRNSFGWEFRFADVPKIPS